ncbi:predicted protein [Botrytis cinerea T4]|uniref:Uncharacterized protein n=1 Tax=Botryotinia fuckeliana (strain T4) TaxID=999810 RepID=G2YDF1_BOTF4|nr:predicted protein [Botrytis cinerea T4]
MSAWDQNPGRLRTKKLCLLCARDMFGEKKNIQSYFPLSSEQQLEPAGEERRERERERERKLNLVAHVILTYYSMCACVYVQCRLPFPLSCQAPYHLFIYLSCRSQCQGRTAKITWEIT